MAVMPTYEDFKPTPFAEVNKILRILLTDVHTILADNFVGLYLYGSLSSGDFNPQTSDIDFVVVTESLIDEGKIEKLRLMHERIMHSRLKFAQKLEGSYVPRKYIRRLNSNNPPIPTINEGKFYLASHGSDWVIQHYILREQGVVVAGPSPITLIDPVKPNDLRKAVINELREWWQPMLDDLSFLLRDDYQAFAILTMCRALYTLEKVEIASKKTSATWAQSKFKQKSQLIEKAMAWKEGVNMDSIGATMDFIRFTIEKSKRYEETLFGG
jgi:hypothetical protein